MRLSGEDEAEKGERNCAEEGDNVSGCRALSFLEMIKRHYILVLASGAEGHARHCFLGVGDC
jgi:hypothetical protein